MALRQFIMRIGIIVTAVLIIIGVILTIWMLNDRNRQDVIDIGLDSTISPISFDKLKLMPGDSTEYTLAFKGKKTKVYDVRLDFEDVNEEGTLKNFIRIKIMSGETEIYDGLLAEAIEKEFDELRVDFKRGKNTTLKLIYYMPLEVGNEAKLATTDFRMHINATTNK